MIKVFFILDDKEWLIFFDVFFMGWSVVDWFGFEFGDIVVVFGVGFIGFMVVYSVIIRGVFLVYVVDYVLFCLVKVVGMGVVFINFI